MRALVELVSDLPIEFFRETFPDFILLKRLVRLPMIILFFSCGILAGLSLAIFKIVGESITANPKFTWFIFYLIVCGIACVIIILYLTNVALKIYRQIEVVPVCESMIIIFTIAAGLCIFDESSYYSWLELAGIFGSTVLVLIGIVILMFKHSVVKEKEPGFHLYGTLVSDDAESNAKAKKEKLLLTVREALNKK